MGWSPEAALVAYLDTVRLCKLHQQRQRQRRPVSEPQSTEFISALAAGMSAELIVEVISCGATSSTIALAAAVRQTGGHLVCILPNIDSLQGSVDVMREVGLQDTTEFAVGDAKELLGGYKNVDFALVDCNYEDDHSRLFDLLKLNPHHAVVVANNLFDKKSTMGCAGEALKRRGGDAKSVTLPIGKGMEIVRLNGDINEYVDHHHVMSSPHRMTSERKCVPTPKVTKNRWIVEIDERTGEEHVFRICKNR